MSSDLNEAVKQFEAVEANLGKLERLWKEIEVLLPDSERAPGVSDDAAYRQLARTFHHIVKQMPRIGEFELQDAVLDPDQILRMGVDTLEAFDFDSSLNFASEVRAQGDILAEYRFRFDTSRRQLARDAITNLCNLVERDLEAMRPFSESTEQIPAEHWEQLRGRVKQIDALLGSSVQRPPRWGDLTRHLHFAANGDYEDIVVHDWPAIRTGFEKVLYGETDPLPVKVKDLAEIVAAKPSGPVSTALKWENLSDADFERLIFNIISRAPNYENPQWLTHTNATDRGRDLSVFRQQRDSLVGLRRLRVFLACKKMKRVGFEDVNKLIGQMAFWTNPRVDELIIVASGRFSTDAVEHVEKHNESDRALRVVLWPESHLEHILAERPELIAEFNLR